MQKKTRRFSFLLSVIVLTLFLILSSFSLGNSLHDCHDADCIICTVFEVFKEISFIAASVLFTYFITGFLLLVGKKIFPFPDRENNSLLSLVKRKVKLTD